MRDYAFAVCRWCRKRQRVEYGTDGNGRLVRGPLPCRCRVLVARRLCVVCREPSGRYVGVCQQCRAKRKRAQRHARRRCADCHRPPRSVRALRCEGCDRERRKKQARRDSLAYYHRTKGRHTNG